MGDGSEWYLHRAAVLTLTTVDTRRRHVHQSREVEHRIRRQFVFRHHESFFRKALLTVANRAHFNTVPTAYALVKLGKELLELVIAVKLSKLRRHGFTCHLNHDSVQLLTSPSPRDGLLS